MKVNGYVYDGKLPYKIDTIEVKKMPDLTY